MSKPITLKLDGEQAINLLLLLNRECKDYSIEFAPQRIIELRDVVTQLDALLDDHYNVVQ